MTAAVYSRVKGYDFVLMDDALHILDNPYLQKPSAENLATLWKRPYQGLYVPTTYTIWGINAALSPKLSPLLDKTKPPEPVRFSPALYHLTNLVLHSLSAVLVFYLLLTLSFAVWPAIAGALLFALHPVQVESVAWVSGTKDTASGFFAILSLLLYFRADRSLWKQLSAVFCFLLAILAKPSVVTLPLAIFILDQIKNRPWRQSLARLVPWALVSLPVLYLTRNSQPETLMRYVTPWWGRPVIVSDTIVFYLSKILFPLFLAPDYARNPRVVLSHPFGYLSVVVFGVLAVWFWKKDKQSKLLFLLFIVLLLPVLGIVPFFFQFFSTVADRYLYLALLAPAIALAAILSNPPSQKVHWMVGLMIVGYSVITFKQIQIWQNDEKLFTHLVAVNPNSLMGRNNLGTILERQDRYDEAGWQYRQALRLDPFSLPALYNLGRIAGRQKSYLESIHYLERLISLAPGLSEAHYTLGMVYREVGNFDRSLIHLSYATQSSPELARAHYQLGLTFQLMNRREAAALSFRRALEINPLLSSAETHLKELIQSPIVDGKSTIQAKRDPLAPPKNTP